MTSCIVVPKTVRINEIKSKNCALSPSLFKAVEIRNPNKKKLKELLDRELRAEDRGTEIGSDAYIYNSEYFFIRTRALQSTSFLLNYDSESVVPVLPQRFKHCELKEGDILISKDSNVGEVVIVDKDLPNHMLSGGIYKLPISNLKYYLLAFMKSDFFKTQLNFLVSRGATIKHAKTLFLDCLIPFPNQNNSNEVITYVELLTQSIINKEKEIRKKHQLIIEKIEREILENQQPDKSFIHKLPTIRDIQKAGRLDAGYYSVEYLKKQFYIKNYKYGARVIFDFGFNVKRGQSLGVSAIGKSIYTDTKKHNFYTLIRPMNFSDYGTVEQFEYFGNSQNLISIKEGDIVISVKGTVGKSIFFTNVDGKWITNCDAVILRKKDYNVIENAFIACFIMFLRKWGIFDYMSTAGQNRNLAITYWSDIYICNFPEDKQKEIAKLYYNYIDYPSDLNINNFLQQDTEWNKKVGILQLDYSTKKLKEKLNKVIHQIVMDEKVDIDFQF